jgi:uncharacterized membrane-anchored protein YhcB (DUF1043 family)
MTEQEKILDLERRVSRLERLLLIIKTVALALVVGMFITALIFRIITVKEAQEVLKTIK